MQRSSIQWILFMSPVEVFVVGIRSSKIELDCLIVLFLTS